MQRSVRKEAMSLCAYHLRWVIIFSALINLAFLAPTVYMLQIYDRVLSSNSIPTLVFLSLALAAALGFQSSLDQIRQKLLLSASVTLDRVFSLRLLTRLMAGRSAAKSVRLSKALRDLDTIRLGATGPGLLALIDLPWAILYIGVAFLIHWSLGLIVLCSAAVLFTLATINERVGRGYYANASSAASASMSIQEAVSGHAGVIRALGMSSRFVELLNQRRQAANRPQFEAQTASSNISGIIKFVRLLLQSLALGIGAFLAIQKLITPGEVFACSMIMSRALAPMDQVVANWRVLQTAATAYADLNHLLGPVEQPNKTVLPVPRPRLSVEKLSLHLPGRTEPVLKNINLNLEGGEIVALVGASGAGKTSLLQVLSGALDPTEGVVKVDGARIDDWEPDRLGRFIGYGPQEPSLFPGTIKDNISRFDSQGGDPPFDVDAAVLEAADKAGAHHMILSLPAGYDTVLGPNGQGLSAGQRQRIAFSRALYGAPPIMLLDEPNAGLDDLGERILIDVLVNLKNQGVLVIVAAHWPRLIFAADSVAVLVDGAVDRFGATKDIVSIKNPQTARGAGLAGAVHG